MALKDRLILEELCFSYDNDDLIPESIALITLI